MLIVETACTPELSSPEDPENPLCRYRTSSFKRAIERGQSNDSSNQSFDTYDPISPDITPDRPEPSSYSVDHLSSSLHPPTHHQDITVNFALKPDQYSVHADADYEYLKSHLIPDYTKPLSSGITPQKQPTSSTVVQKQPTSTVVHKQPESILKEPSEGKKKSKKVDIELGGGGLWDLERQDSGGSMDQVFLDPDSAAASGNLLTVADLEG